MTATSLLVVAALLVGVTIGAVGIGGVFLAPALILIGEVEPHQATAISLIAFTLTGVVSAALHLRDDAVPRVLTRNLAAGLLPGAFAGGWLSGRIPAAVILAALSGCCLASALWTLTRARGPRPGNTAATGDQAARGGRAGRADLGAPSAAAIGLVVGFGSAVTGTSGPVLLTPILIALRLPTWRVIVVGQVIQVVVTPAGALGHLARARPDLGLTAVLGAATAAGAAIGIWGMRRLRPPDALLRDLVTALLAVTGVLVAIRLAGAL
ncbi:MAG TPA: sulfite exporter TauE/SafE family protein [Streptosporangiaceae bacterium]|nr:sulfite exporter TauE/SafE family protein [Streptosporangiaceae bacterium]